MCPDSRLISFYWPSLLHSVLWKKKKKIPYLPIHPPCISITYYYAHTCDSAPNKYYWMLLTLLTSRVYPIRGRYCQIILCYSNQQQSYKQNNSCRFFMTWQNPFGEPQGNFKMFTISFMVWRNTIVSDTILQYYA